MTRGSSLVVAYLQHRSAQKWPFPSKRAFLDRTVAYCRQLIYFLVDGSKAGIAMAKGSAHHKEPNSHRRGHGGRGGKTKTRKSKLGLESGVIFRDPPRQISTRPQHPPIEAFYTRLLFFSC